MKGGGLKTVSRRSVDPNRSTFNVGHSEQVWGKYVASKTQNPTMGQFPSAIWGQMISLLGAKSYPRKTADIIPIAKEVRALWSADPRYLSMVRSAIPSILNDLRRLKAYPEQFAMARSLVHRLYTSPTSAMKRHPHFSEVKVELQYCVNGYGPCGQKTTAVVELPATSKSRRQKTSIAKKVAAKKAEAIASS